MIPCSACVPQVIFGLSYKDLEYMDLNLRPALEEGIVLFGVGDASDCRARPEECASLAVSLKEDHQPACKVSPAGDREAYRYKGLGVELRNT